MDLEDQESWHLRYFDYSFFIYITFAVLIITVYLLFYCVRTPTQKIRNLADILQDDPVINGEFLTCLEDISLERAQPFQYQIVVKAANQLSGQLSRRRATITHPSELKSQSPDNNTTHLDPQQRFQDKEQDLTSSANNTDASNGSDSWTTSFDKRPSSTIVKSVSSYLLRNSNHKTKYQTLILRESL